jgi:CheY-like chemotaxis protein
MAPIMTAIQLMKLQGAQHFVQERQVIERQVRHLVRLVDDLLDVSRMTRGNLSIEHASVDLADVLAASVELSSPLIEQHAHELTVHVAPDLVVRGDAMRLRQVFSNLLNNAAKYTQRGGHIVIWADRVGDDARVHIRDTGIGISSDMLARLFEPFVQERQSLERSAGGLGLGLAIVRSLVTLHGGTVEAFSHGPGCGSEFTVCLPLAVGAAIEPLGASLDREHAETASALRILVVDDNVDAVTLLVGVLGALGHQVRLAHDGPSALRELEQFRPDLALLDLGLPVMDGFELARHIRGQGSHGAIPLVALTGYGDATTRVAARDAGFDGHLLKPLELTHLQKLLAELKR